ncbi:threonine synthase-like 2 [Antennarius striatus]|uniref:threonine synthase-like 2 n=1 Tax=Antennarius striatus TaxID=241820 RepID=UPI0035B17D1C
MLYCSTRGGVQGRDFRDVLFSGFTSDGGLFMPESIPELSADILRDWRKLSYTKLVVEVCSLFIPTQLIPREDLEVLVDKALSGFSIPEVVRIAHLKDGLSVLELFHGESLAFKDLSISCTVHFLNYILQKENDRVIILVGTSGDTGGSAIQSSKGLSGLDVVVVYPKGRVTPVQEKHMIACVEDNIHVFAAEGSSDDIDQVVRHVFGDLELVKCHRLLSLNTVNWSRVMIQLVHFIYAYLELSGVEGDGDLPELEVVIPTGAAGNLTAAYIVKLMGLPLKLVAMVNCNDILHRMVTTGDFSMEANVIQTLSSAIDIQDPINIERVLWLLLGRDAALVQTIMEEFQQTHKYTLLEHHRRMLSQVFSTGRVTDEDILDTMKKCWDENHYLLCPHTAVGVWHHYHCPDTSRSRCFVATASPAKFQSAVQMAGLPFDLPESLLALDQLPTRFENLERSVTWRDDWEKTLKEKILSLSSLRKNGQM